MFFANSDLNLDLRIYPLSPITLGKPYSVILGLAEQPEQETMLFLFEDEKNAIFLSTVCKELTIVNMNSRFHLGIYTLTEILIENCDCFPLLLISLLKICGIALLKHIG